MPDIAARASELPPLESMHRVPGDPHLAGLRCEQPRQAAIVGYGTDAKATVDLVRQAGIHVVMGNCEEALAQAAADCGCGFAPGSACDRLSAAWFAHAQSELGPAERAWMAVLPRRLEVELAPAGVTLAVMHGGLEALNRFVFASTPGALKAAEWSRAGRPAKAARTARRLIRPRPGRETSRPWP